MNDDKDSTWLYEVLDSIGANDDYRKTIQQSGITFEIICTFGSENKKMANYGVGGKWEGTLTPGVKTDFDAISCDDNVIVIEDISKAVQNRYSLLIVRDPRTPAGYVKLQIVRGKEPGTITHLSFYDSKFKSLFKIDECKRILLTEIINEHMDNKPFMSRPKIKPAATIGNYNGININLVICYRCKHWPVDASEWLTRR
ncbi:P4HA [Mytilus coruscus]|uniref:P4HA n=1 Tax=Mytilus coruscus TaxID=42192 RepID=A0A6J8CWN7_MYTCO|nr:P4HA [Mytilus coruscus]